MSNTARTRGHYIPASIRIIMESWTLQTGYPVVDVNIDLKTGKATLKQVEGKKGHCLPSHHQFFALFSSESISLAAAGGKG